MDFLYNEKKAYRDKETEKRDRNLRGGFYEREKQRAEGEQEGTAVELKREEKTEAGKKEQLNFWSTL